MKRRKVTGIAAGVVGIVLLAAGLYAAVKERASIGMIGGADGPTAIIVSSGVNGWYVAFAGVLLALMAAVLLCRKKR